MRAENDSPEWLTEAERCLEFDGGRQATEVPRRSEARRHLARRHLRRHRDRVRVTASCLETRLAAGRTPER